MSGSLDGLRAEKLIAEIAKIEATGASSADLPSSVREIIWHKDRLMEADEDKSYNDAMQEAVDLVEKSKNKFPWES